MLREISTQVLINMKINAHQAIIGLLLMGDHYEYLDAYLKESDSYDNFENDLKRLKFNNLVTYEPSRVYTYKSIVVKEDFIKQFSEGDNFMELYGTYPAKVLRPNGVYDHLRKDRRMCRDIYTIVTKDRQDFHDHIMGCLKYELQYRKLNNTMQYMKRLPKWLSGHEWENYEDHIADGSSLKPRNTYGTELR